MKFHLLLLLLLPLLSAQQFSIQCYGEDFLMVNHMLLDCSSADKQACYTRDGGGITCIRASVCLCVCVYSCVSAEEEAASGVCWFDSLRNRRFTRAKMYYYRYENTEVSCCYKYLMFSYNIIFWLVGVAFIAVGFWAWSEKGVLVDLTQVTRLHGFDPVWLVLVVGGVTFILGFAGCVGALRENICLLKFFSGVIGFIFFLELTAAVLTVVFQSQVRDWINEFFLANVKAYRDDIDLQNLIDSLQKMNHCCGAQEPDDWERNVYFSCNGTHRSREKCGVPFSCCVTDPADSVVNTQCGYDVRVRPESEWSDHIFTKGCITALEDWLPGNLYTVAIVFIVISLLQMVGIYLARTLISDIEKVKLTN